MASVGMLFEVWKYDSTYPYTFKESVIQSSELVSLHPKNKAQKQSSLKDMQSVNIQGPSVLQIYP